MTMTFTVDFSIHAKLAPGELRVLEWTRAHTEIDRVEMAKALNYTRGYITRCLWLLRCKGVLK